MAERIPARATELIIGGGRSATAGEMSALVLGGGSEVLLAHAPGAS
jgi:hypothetical protein